MTEEKRSLHLRLQEYCDCYMETDPQEEIKVISKEGASADVTKDAEEVALKFLSLAILYGIKENAKKISLVKQGKGEVRLAVEAAGKYVLPAPPPALTDAVFEVMRSITHLEGKKAKEPLSLGMRNDNLELMVGFDSSAAGDILTIGFPNV